MRPPSYWSSCENSEIWGLYLDSILKSRDITLSTEVHLVKAMVFLVVMYRCESWTVKKAEHWGIDAFELWCWRRLLRVPWTARRSNQSILKEIGAGCLLETLMLKLKLQYFGHLMQRVTHLKRPWCWERLRAGGEGDNRGWDGWMASPTSGHGFGWTPGVGDGQGGLACCGSWGLRVRHNWVTEWNELNTVSGSIMVVDVAVISTILWEAKTTCPRDPRESQQWLIQQA